MKITAIFNAGLVEGLKGYCRLVVLTQNADKTYTALTGFTVIRAGLDMNRAERDSWTNRIAQNGRKLALDEAREYFPALCENNYTA